MGLRSVRSALAAAVAVGAAALAAPGVASAASSGSPALELLGQSAAVTPVAPGDPAPFEVTVRVFGAVPDGAELGLSFYDKLGSRSAFEQTIGTTPNGLLQTVAPTALSGLKAVDGGYQFSVTVMAGVPERSGSDTVGLLGARGRGCVAGNGTCSGVYPVVVTLFGSDGAVLAHLTTYLVFAEARSADPLVFSWVVPIGSPVRIRTTGPLDRAVPALGPSRVSDLAALTGTLAANPSVQVTLDPSGATVDGLVASRAPGARAAVAGLRTVAVAGPGRVVAGSYVPINLAELGTAALGGVLGTQTQADAAALGGVLGGLPLADQPDRAIWIAPGGVSASIAKGLSEVGATSLVLPDADLPGDTEGGSATWAQPFQLPLGRQSVTAAVSDGQLSSHFTDAPNDPVLEATQVLADLAMIQSELPNARATRGVIAVPPAGWDPDPLFVTALVSGLANDPVVSTATLTQFFSTVPVGGNQADTTRHLAASADGEHLTSAEASGLVAASGQIDGFRVATRVGAPTVADQLEELLLTSESSELRPAAQRSGLATFERHLDAELSAIQVVQNTVTMTARTASIPITIISSADYQLTATLTLSSPKLQFPDGATRILHIDHPTNSVQVVVRARTTGDLPLTFTLTSAGGELVIAHGRLTVRSTATSIVGIVLTAVAAVVLLGWWARTWSRGRRRRRARVST